MVGYEKYKLIRGEVGIENFIFDVSFSPRRDM
jgi:hypothetical protein